MKKFLIDFLYN